MNTIEVTRDKVWHAVLKRVAHTQVVVDIGPGIRPQDYFLPAIHLCVEAHTPYVDRVRADRDNDRRLVFLLGTWQEILPHLPDKSVDTAFALDLIEHLSREEGYQLLAELVRVSRFQIVVFTPLGMYPQSYQQGEKDAWGMDGGHWQTHRSGWLPEDFARLTGSWEAVVCRRFHLQDQHGERLSEPFGAFWAIGTISPPPSGAKTAWTAARGERLRRIASSGARRASLLMRSPGKTSREVLRRLFEAKAN